ncbi:MAG TPA: histidine phosphatase family protein [Isoptericola sp.]|nr:histidine phosphatase family protein [Isoptericola sp.]
MSSDLRRTAQTAAVIGDLLGVAPDFDSRLQEKTYGVAGGREQAWLDERFVSPPAVATVCVAPGGSTVPRRAWRWRTGSMRQRLTP